MDEYQEPTVTSVVKQETARQTVAFIFSVLGTVAAVYVMKKLQEPDAMRTLKMRWYLEQSKAWAWASRYTTLKRDDAWQAYAKEMYQ